MIDWNDPIMQNMKTVWQSQSKPKVMEVEVDLLRKYYKRLVEFWGKDEHLPYCPLTFRGSFIIPKL